MTRVGEGDGDGAVHPEVVGGIWTGSGELTVPAGQEHGVAAGDDRAPRVERTRRFRDQRHLRDALARAGSARWLESTRQKPEPPARMEPSTRPTWRTLLVLGRVSNLPTVWSNALCGWLLGGGGSVARLVVFSLASSAMYIGGMYLNDAFDTDFDRQHRRERPIPSGAIREALVWQVGGALLLAGSAAMACMGWSTALLGVLLLGSIILYDAVHKAVAFSPVIMASCRVFLLLAASSTGAQGVTGIVLWAALVLAGWIMGLSYVARRESLKGTMDAWPLAALALPIVLATIVRDGAHRIEGLLWSAIVVSWAIKCLLHVFAREHRNLGRAVSGLLAGICLVDLLAAGASATQNAAFLALFAAALVLQRFVPAT